MLFSEGQTVIHPHHGPATVQRLDARQIKDRLMHYVHLTVHATGMDVAIPLDSADQVGLRPVCTATEVDELLEVLAAPGMEEETQWSRRMKANQERLRTGDLPILAALIRDMMRREVAHGLSGGERDLLKTAKQPVVAEIALALDISEDEAAALVEERVGAQAEDEARAADDDALVTAAP